jgi:signal transduction histidine kinase
MVELAAGIVVGALGLAMAAWLGWRLRRTASDFKIYLLLERERRRLERRRLALEHPHSAHLTKALDEQLCALEREQSRIAARFRAPVPGASETLHRALTQAKVSMTVPSLSPPARKVPAKRAPIAIFEELIFPLSAHFAGLTQTRRITIAWSHSRHVPPVYASEPLLRHVVYDILHQAITSAPEDSTVRISGEDTPGTIVRVHFERANNNIESPESSEPPAVPAAEPLALENELLSHQGGRVYVTHAGDRTRWTLELPKR